MSDSVFNYPGAKTNLSSWIIDHFPRHQTYVEPFAGSAAILANKPPSDVEVLNDRDGDIVQFFEVLRDRPDELVEWLRHTPHSRKLQEKYARHFYQGLRPNDPVERAGRFWYLRETQFAAKYNGPSGYNGSTNRNTAAGVANKRERLLEFSERFDHVQIENNDYRTVAERYDSAESFFYFDPPYVKEGDELYSGGDFDHERFTDTVLSLDGLWCVSYTDVPPGLADAAERIVERDQRVTMRAGQGNWEKTNTERLVMNYDPDTTPLFVGAEASSLAEF